MDRIAIPEYLMKTGYLEKQDLRGSYKGMCYRLHAESSVEKGPLDKLRVWCWPQPLCLDAADEESKQSAEFIFAQEGIDEAHDWLSEQYFARKWPENRILSSKNP